MPNDELGGFYAFPANDQVLNPLSHRWRALGTGADALGGRSPLSVLTALTVSSTAAYIFVLILVAIPILYWIILALTGRLGRRR